ncbi:hypothetical protein [Bordetella sp. LUAb4]|uniref:hypothetical protein n=1 Tax=Bordetella sp. LUAb4 TaxID=2843195 RepID=UPI001E5BCDD8|nr:hypothetical protein [Bordetella sp. LUAb4]
MLATLLLALGASAWGGVQFGDWLVAHAPAASPSTEDAGFVLPVARDAHGDPILSQPPQPLVNGSLGVPETTVLADWRVDRKSSLFGSPRDPLVQLSRSTVSLAQARAIAAEIQAAQAAEGAASYTQLRAARDLVPQAALQSLDMLSVQAMTAAGKPPAAAPQLLASAGGGYVGVAPALAAAATRQMPVLAAPAAATSQDWRDALKRELSQCASLGFFDRPTCAWTARNRYCGPNQAWGTLRECPRKVE